MPTYTVRDPQTGRTITLRGESAPTEAELSEIFASLGGEQTANSGSSLGDSINPATVGAANAGRAAAGRVGMQVATSPNVGRAANALVNNASVAGGFIGGGPGATVGKALEAVGGNRIANLIQGGAATLAKIAASPAARFATGPVAQVASMPISESGDRPAGESMEAFRARQEAFAQQARAMGHKVPKTEDVVRQVLAEQARRGNR